MYGGSFYGASMYGASYWGTGEAASASDPFGDARYAAYGERVRRGAAIWAVFLCLLVG